METKAWRRFDFFMFLCTLLLIGYGLLMIHSATFSPESEQGVSSLVIRQGAFALGGILILLLMAAIDYEILGSLSVPIYLLGLLAMVGVLVVGNVTHGSQRWFDLGFTTIEPSDPAKIVVAIVLAKFLADREEDIHKFRTILLSALIVAPFIGLTLLQPNLGTAIVYLVMWGAMVIMAGMRFLHAALLVVAGLIAAPIAWFALLPYMHGRVATFLNPYADPLGDGYNVIQALISVGSGGLFGRGFLSGTQSQLHFLRVQYADFIFSVLAEELGFIGAMVLFVLFIGLLLRAVRTASIAHDGFGRLLATGILAMLGFQIFVNIGINIGLLPVTGLPLPFISYGGSSLVTMLIGIGVLQSIAVHHRKATGTPL